MNFTLSTKPLADSLDLGVINANVSKFYQRSCLAQLTADRHTLRINLEASNISSEILLKGSGDSDEPSVAFVDCVVFKQLVGSFETSTVSIEFVEGGIILHSGTSKFSLSSMVEDSDMELTRPSLPSSGTFAIKVDQSDWKFIKNYQMYAVAMSFVHPVYTKVWVSEDGTVIVGDFDNSLFTFSTKSKLGKTCLISDTIVNLFNNLPEGATISTLGKSYRIDVKTDGFEYGSEFTPQYEEDAGVGSYSSDVILQMVVKDNSNCIKVPVASVIKFLNQAEMLSHGTDDTISVDFRNSVLQFKDSNIDCKLSVEGTCSDFDVVFKTSMLKSVLNNVDEDSVNISPMSQEGVTIGIIVWTKNISVVLGGVE